jgi:hypothetical protein
MKSLGQLSPISTIEAKIQGRVAKFLGLKETVLRLTKSPSLSIQSEARELYNTQLLLEKELQTNLKRIEQIKSGAYTYSNILQVGDFAYNMENHIGKVQKLEEKTKGADSEAITANLFTSRNLVIGAVIAGFYFLVIK